jgi:hypothetical protein
MVMLSIHAAFEHLCTEAGRARQAMAQLRPQIYPTFYTAHVSHKNSICDCRKQTACLVYIIHSMEVPVPYTPGGWRLEAGRHINDCETLSSEILQVD